MRGAASEARGWGAELGVTEWADSGARSSTSDPLGQGNHEQALAGSLGTQGFRSSSKLPGERQKWKWRSGMGMEVAGKGTGRRKSLFPRRTSRPRGWLAGPPLQPTGAENAPGTGHRAPRRSAAPPRPAPRSSPPARHLAPPRRLTVRRNWISSSPPSPPSAMAPETSALPPPPALLPPRQPLGVRRLLLRSSLLFFLLLLGSWLGSAAPS